MIRGAITSNRVELDKLYFFIARVIDPTTTPGRKSNSQISFSQIEPYPFPISLILPLSLVRRYPIPRHSPLPLSHGKRPSGIFLARVILSTPFRSIAITSSSEKLFATKMNAWKSRGIQKRGASASAAHCLNDGSLGRQTIDLLSTQMSSHW